MVRIGFQVGTDGQLCDGSGRTVLLRGINLDASAKLPMHPNVTTYVPVTEEFWHGDDVSFVGRPFAVDEADAHFERIRSWGYNTIRYVYTWEALEHAGPGVYDDEFIDYTIKILQVAKKHGLHVFMDPHQDIWGRYSGGSGAPLWTYYAAGLDPRSFQATEAALVQNSWPDGPAEFPKMIWAMNYYRLAAQTMFTLFFAGREFAPKCIINGVNIQDFLQQHMLNAMIHFYRRLYDETDLFDDCIFGLESMNEPNYGYIGLGNIDVVPHGQNLRLGTTPTAFQGMLLGSGRAQTVEYYEFGSLGPVKKGHRTVDPQGVQAWLQTDRYDNHYGFRRGPEWKLGVCIWAQHGVWDPAEDKVLVKDYFASHLEDAIDEPYFVNVYFTRYWADFHREMRQHFGPDVFLLCQPPVLAIPPPLKGTSMLDGRCIYAPHFYDGLTLMLKKWNPLWNVDGLGYLRGKYSLPVFAIKIGERAIRACLEEQITTIRDEGRQYMGDIPCMMTETGVPFDMNDRESYTSGQYEHQIQALDAISNGLDGSGIHHSYWVYSALNRHEYGDFWNGEDFSFWSQSNALHPDHPGDRDDDLDPIVHTRAREAFDRPFPLAVRGRALERRFDVRKRIFTLRIDANSENGRDPDAPTEIYVPAFHFPLLELDVQVSSGKVTIDDDSSTLLWWHDDGEQKIQFGATGDIPAASSDDDLACGCSIM